VKVRPYSIEERAELHRRHSKALDAASVAFIGRVADNVYEIMYDAVRKFNERSSR
jgi:hypothetical protein